MSKYEGKEIVPLHPGWIKREWKNVDEDFNRIFLFYVVHTPCEDLSSSSIPISKYGWKPDVWKKPNLKNKLFEVAGLERDKTFFSVKTLDVMKEALQKSNLSKGCHKKRDTERICIYKPSRYNECLAIFYHIRNALAHGRFAVYEISDSNKDQMFVFEDGKKCKNEFEVRSRIILKKSTLITWIKIMENQQPVMSDGGIK